MACEIGDHAGQAQSREGLRREGEASEHWGLHGNKTSGCRTSSHFLWRVTAVMARHEKYAFQVPFVNDDASWRISKVVALAERRQAKGQTHPAV